RHRGGEIQAPCLRAHGDAEAVVRMGVEQGFWQTAGFRAEDKAALCRKLHLPGSSSGLGGEEELRAGNLRCKLLPGVPKAEVDFGPVVEPRTLQITILQAEAERLDEMEPRSRGEAKPAYRACIVRNLGLVEDDVKHAMCDAAFKRKALWQT